MQSRIRPFSVSSAKSSFPPTAARWGLNTKPYLVVSRCRSAPS